MTSKFTYYPDPGIAYDISKMLFVKLNPTNVWLDILTSPANVKAEITHIQKCADALPAPNSKMLLFSFVPSNQKTTFLTSVISHLLDSGIHSFSISKLTSYLNDYTLVKNDLINFYFESIRSYTTTSIIETVWQSFKSPCHCEKILRQTLLI